MSLYLKSLDLCCRVLTKTWACVLILHLFAGYCTEKILHAFAAGCARPSFFCQVLEGPETKYTKSAHFSTRCPSIGVIRTPGTYAWEAGQRPMTSWSFRIVVEWSQACSANDSLAVLLLEWADKQELIYVDLGRSHRCWALTPHIPAPWVW